MYRKGDEMGTQLVDTIKEVVEQKMEASDLSTFLYGTVESASPLQIGIDSDKKLSLTSEFLVLTKNVTDYEVEIDIEYENEWETEKDCPEHPHKHEIKGKKKFKVLNALKAGDKVVLVRQQGGQKYLVIDKIGGA